LVLGGARPVLPCVSASPKLMIPLPLPHLLHPPAGARPRLLGLAVLPAAKPGPQVRQGGKEGTPQPCVCVAISCVCCEHLTRGFHAPCSWIGVTAEMAFEPTCPVPLAVHVARPPACLPHLPLPLPPVPAAGTTPRKRSCGATSCGEAPTRGAPSASPAPTHPKAGHPSSLPRAPAMAMAACLAFPCAHTAPPS